MAQTGYTPILIYASGTASNVPLAANLANGLSGAELALNYADGKLFYKDSGGVVRVLASKATGTIGGSTNQVQYNSSGSLAGSANFTFDGTSITLANNPTLSGGTANGVAYLNASKVLTTGSALTFDGTTLTTTNLKLPSSGSIVDGGGNSVLNATSGGSVALTSNGAYTNGNIVYNALAATGVHVFSVNSVEQMRLTSTGLGIGLTPAFKFDVLATGTESGRFRTTGALNALYLADSGTTAGTLYIGTVGNDFRVVTGSNERLRIANAGNVTINAPSSGTALTTTAVTNGVANLWLDSGQQANLTFAGGETTFGTTTSHVLNLQTAGTKRVAVSTTGNVTINAPSSGDGLTVSGNIALGSGNICGWATSAAYTIGANPNATVTSGGFVQFFGSTNGTPSLVNIGTNNATRMQFNATGNATIFAPGSGTALSVNGTFASDRFGINANPLSAASTAQSYLRFQSTGGDFYSGIESSVGGAFFPSSTAYSACLYNANATPMHFYTSATLRATLDSSGNLGIGTSSPARKLDVNGTIRIADGQSVEWGGTSLYIAGTSNTLLFGTSSTERMRIDSSGNLGLGVTPSAWSSYKSISVSNGLALYSSSSGVGNGGIAFNAYFDGANWKYRNTDYATNYYQYLGQHLWFTAPSGTAGNAITFTQAMTLDSSGNLLVGTTSVFSASRLTIQGNATYSAAILGTAGNTTSNSLFIGLGGDRSTDTTYSAINYVDTDGTGTARFRVYGNGNVVNTNNSYGAISDAKLKENVTDATPKLEKLCKVRIVNYNLIADEAKEKRIGVIAQELEQVFPSLVDESADLDEEGNPTGTTTKAVKYSVFVPMLIKAMQEQQAIINDLTQRLAVLEGKA